MNPVPETCNPNPRLVSTYSGLWYGRCSCGWSGSYTNKKRAVRDCAQHLTIPCQGRAARGAPCKRRSVAYKAYCSHHGDMPDRVVTLLATEGTELSIGVSVNGQWWVSSDNDEYTVEGNVTIDRVREFVEKLRLEL